MSTQTNRQNFVVEMTLQPVPEDAYQKLGRAEMEYTQVQMEAGKLAQLLVTTDHRRYWMVFAVADEAELRAVLEGFPLHAFFNYQINPVIDMVAATADGLTDPNLD